MVYDSLQLIKAKHPKKQLPKSFLRENGRVMITFASVQNIFYFFGKLI